MGLRAATRFPSILLRGSLITIVVCGEAVPALRLAGILPAKRTRARCPRHMGMALPWILAYIAKQ